MLEIISVVAPVFVIIAAGYGAVRTHLFPKTGVAGLIIFVNAIATPCLLFRAMYEVDFGETFTLDIFLPYYLGAFVCFAVGIFAARAFFQRRPGESVVTGFSAFFSNTVLVGIPVIERAYGVDALTVTFAIISVHAAILFSTGMVTMELARRDGAPLGVTLLRAARSLVTNPILIGVVLGVAGNLSGLPMPGLVDDVTELMALAVIPVALFGLGGALNEYRVSENWQEATLAAGLKLVLHPLIAYVMTVHLFGVPIEVAKIVVLLSAMPSGINTYIFATYYNRNTGMAASAVLISTVAAFASLTFWLWFLGLG